MLKVDPAQYTFEYFLCTCVKSPNFSSQLTAFEPTVLIANELSDPNNDIKVALCNAEEK